MIVKNCVIEPTGRFNFCLPINYKFSSGDYVAIRNKKNVFFGQIFSISFDINELLNKVGKRFIIFSIRSKKYYLGSGQILAEINRDDINLQYKKEDCYGESKIERASAEIIQKYLNKCNLGQDPLLTIGTIINADKPVTINIKANGFNRNIGIFGQSGSGKSYALGIILEEMHLKTAISSVDIVVLDPNGDYIKINSHLKELIKINQDTSKRKIGTDEYNLYIAEHERRKGQIIVYSASPNPDQKKISVRLSDLDVKHQLALLGLFPDINREEYFLYSDIINKLVLLNPNYNISEFIDYCKKLGSRESIMLKRLLQNLEIDKFKIWEQQDPREPKLIDQLKAGTNRFYVIDLSDLSNIESSTISTIIFNQLWQIQIKRKREGIEKGTILVVDEAHELFPKNAVLKNHMLTLDWGIKIAGEGRKYGLYLTLSSQLPSKIHEFMLTQCGNLVLLKMISHIDLKIIEENFSYVPREFLYKSKQFEKGEALISGKFVQSPCLVHFEGRKTEEGGKDLEINWA